MHTLLNLCGNIPEFILITEGKGHWLDNVVAERFWCSIKYEDIYLKSYENAWELERGIEAYMMCYNFEGPHQSLGEVTPEEGLQRSR